MWTPYQYDQTAWRELTTTAPISHGTDGKFEAPDAVLQTAVTPVNSTVLRFLQWLPETNAASPPSYFSVIHQVEFVNLTGNASRWFNITLNGEYKYGPVKPEYLYDSYIYNVRRYDKLDHYEYALVANENATLPPLINAAQIYSILELPTPMADEVQGEPLRCLLNCLIGRNNLKISQTKDLIN